jgi:phosphoserine phosphatase
VRGGFRAVVFDCDSTLVEVEGIDELAGDLGAEVRALTAAAMDGRVPLDEVYGRRLALIRPDRARIEALGRRYRETLVPDAPETVAALGWLGKAVWIVSGGLLPPVVALAAAIGVPADRVRAVPIHFHPNGSYAGFDAASPLARSGGKADAIRGLALPRPALLVGDGVTDLEARDEVDAFAVYAGVAARPAVIAAADVVIPSASLAPVLALAADAEERIRLHRSEWAAVLERGEQLLHDAATRPVPLPQPRAP